MPTCGTHNNACNCLLVAIPVPVETDETTPVLATTTPDATPVATTTPEVEDDEQEEEEEEEVATCDNCGETEDDCSCAVCGRCMERFDTVCDNCERCERCCARRGDCFTCDGCHTVRNTDECCSNCNECENCCNCSSCSNCGDRGDSDDYCSSCDCCESCCECGNSGPHCKMLDATNRFHTSNRKQHTINASKRYISAEIEIASLDDRDSADQIYRVCKSWGAGIVPDGSLPDTGFEVNTAPSNGDKFVEQVNAICSALRASDAVVTTECGLHVHIDARDYSHYEVSRLIRLYAKLEDALFSVVPQSRRNSSYCGRCATEYLQAIESGQYRKVKQAVCQAVYKRSDTRGKRDHKYDSSRYSALNLHSWFYRGTIECRLAGGTADADKIANWGILWAAIIDWAAQHTDKDLSMFDGLDSFACLLKVAPTPEVREWLEERKNKFAK